MTANREDRLRAELDKVRSAFLQRSGDFAAESERLTRERDDARADADRERGKVGDLVREVEALRAELDMPTDITRGQLSSWPTAAFTAGPPLPRRTPGESLKPCGWMGIEPMTDPALEDRTEGSEP